MMLQPVHEWSPSHFIGCVVECTAGMCCAVLMTHREEGAGVWAWRLAWCCGICMIVLVLHVWRCAGLAHVSCHTHRCVLMTPLHVDHVSHPFMCAPSPPPPPKQTKPGGGGHPGGPHG
jgi:hypothetical protein